MFKKSQNQRDNAMLLLEWETQFAAAYVTAELNVIYMNRKK